MTQPIDPSDYRAALELIGEHGSDATANAGAMALFMSLSGNEELAQTWGGIARAVEVIQSSGRPHGA